MQHSKETKTAATKLFDKFFTANSIEDSLLIFNQILGVLNFGPGRFKSFFPVFKQCILSNNAQSLFKLIEDRRKNPVYEDNSAAEALTTAIVGCGPCGLRTAIEAQLMGSHVVCVEKRKSFTRNNVLHIWPFIIEDLKMLGVKIFYPKFCTGSMNHISIRRLQCVLLKIALVLGVEIHLGIGFTSVEEPRDRNGGWRVATSPPCPAVNNLDVDVLVGAEGKRVTVPGFPRKEFRGKLAIAITANFNNNHTTAEAVVEEISGVAFVYKQDFFNALYDELGIALENIVYYKDETHYFVMTTKKHSLLARSVLKKDYKDPIELLRPENVHKPALLDYIRDTCDYCTDYQLPNLKFALNHHGEPDVALFDFTSMFAARNSMHVRERHSKQLLSCLVGDGLLEPFWPTGTGCARGFLGAFDACWAMRSWARADKTVLQIISDREAIYKMLPQTTPENIAKEAKRYTIDPSTRYTHINYRLMSAEKVLSLYDSDVAENGWNFPLKGALAAAAANRGGGGGNQHHLEYLGKRHSSSNGFGQGNIAFDLNYLDEKTAEISRQLDTLEQPMTDEKSEYTFKQKMDFLAQKAAAAENRPSLNSRKTKKEAPNKLSDEKRSVLSGGGESEDKRAKKSPPGKLTSDKVAVLRDFDDRLEHERKARQSEKNASAAKSVGKLKVPILRPDDKAAKEKRERRQLQKQQQQQQQKCSPRSFNSELIDFELDDMLHRLEQDDDFRNLSDNEQMAWLESLFYLDTSQSSTPRRNLNHVATNVKSPDHNLKINRQLSADDSANNTLKPSQVGKSASIFKSPTVGSFPTSSSSQTTTTSTGSSTTKKSEPPQGDSLAPPGVNANLVSLAQSYFSADPTKKPKPIKNPSPKPFSPPPQAAQQQQQQQQQPKDPSPLPERAYFEPSCSPGKSPEMTKEDSPEFPPPIPPRSNQTKSAMLRLMKNTTNILKK